MNLNELVPIGTGHTADVYAWGEDSCLKLFKPGFEGDARKEYDIASAIRKGASSLRTPAIRELGHYEGRAGIVFERIAGPLLFEEVMRAESGRRVDELAARFAELHREIHACAVPGLTSPKEEIRESIERCPGLDGERRAIIGALYETLEPIGALCHGDYHPLNVILSADGGAVVIDWTDSRSFHPLADAGKSSAIMQAAQLPGDLVRQFHDAYVKRYLALAAADYDRFWRWQLPVAVARLAANIPGEREPLLQLIDRNLRLLGLLK